MHGSVIGAVDCRSTGPWFNSGWRSWFTFVTGSDNLTNPTQEIQLRFLCFFVVFVVFVFLWFFVVFVFLWFWVCFFFGGGEGGEVGFFFRGSFFF